MSPMNAYGIRGHTLKWIKDFLDNRKQSVVTNGISSSTIPVSSGVPQGSVLGPILFLAYINGLPEQVRSRVRLFADDTAMYLCISSLSEANILQEDLLKLEKWEEDWDMNFIPAKCQVLHVTRFKTPIPSKYFLHNTELESVPAAKYLGVTISEDLSWGNHINNINKKANQTLGCLKRNIKVHNQDLKSTAYKTLVRPQLEYASSVWSPHTDTDIKKIESVQRRSARWATHDYRSTSSVTEMLKKLSWRPLDQRRIDTRLIMLYKKVQVGKDQENAQSEKDSHSKKPRWEKNKLTNRYLYHETYRKPNEQLFSQYNSYFSGLYGTQNHKPPN